MTFRFVFFGALIVGIAVAGPIGFRNDSTETPTAELTNSTTAIAVVDTLNVEIDSNSGDLALGNETHLRQKRCCCCCRPCCGCCGCGGRKRRSIQQLTHKLMDKQAALIRQYEDSSESTTVAPEVLSNAQIDAFGRNYGNIAFADLTTYYKVPENLPQYQADNFY